MTDREAEIRALGNEALESFAPSYEGLVELAEEAADPLVRKLASYVLGMLHLHTAALEQARLDGEPRAIVVAAVKG